MRPAGLSDPRGSEQMEECRELKSFAWFPTSFVSSRNSRSIWLNHLVGWRDSLESDWPATSLPSRGVSCKAVGMIFVGRGRRPLVESEELRSEFEKLVDAWALETMMSSSLHEICSHWAYQRVIGLGSPVGTADPSGRSHGPASLGMGSGGNHWGKSCQGHGFTESRSGGMAQVGKGARACRPSTRDRGLRPRSQGSERPRTTSTSAPTTRTTTA